MTINKKKVLVVALVAGRFDDGLCMYRKKVAKKKKKQQKKTLCITLNLHWKSQIVR